MRDARASRVAQTRLEREIRGAVAGARAIVLLGFTLIVAALMTAVQQGDRA